MPEFSFKHQLTNCDTEDSRTSVLITSAITCAQFVTLIRTLESEAETADRLFNSAGDAYFAEF